MGESSRERLYALPLKHYPVSKHAHSRYWIALASANEYGGKLIACSVRPNEMFQSGKISAVIRYPSSLTNNRGELLESKSRRFDST